jgi:uncharacterized protein YbaR (Trm112 family)
VTGPVTGSSGLDPELLAIIVCPQCRAPLHQETLHPTPDAERVDELVCTGADCGLRYPVRGGIPVLLVDEATRAL